MSRERDDTKWLKRGRQRAAVAQVLRKPMTASEICLEARAINPRIQLRDIWYLLRQMQERQLVSCRNPKLVTGRLYELSAHGQEAVYAGFGILITPAPEFIDWRKYSLVARAKIRRVTLIGLGRLQEMTELPQTATAIRKHLRFENPVALNPVMHALKDLVKLGLVRPDGVTDLRSCRLYRLTPAGRRILDQLTR